MCTTLKSFQTSAFSSETALEAERGTDGLHYRTQKICHPPMENDLFRTKMEGLNEFITESHHSTLITGRIKVCHQLHITVWDLFLSSLMDKGSIFPTGEAVEGTSVAGAGHPLDHAGPGPLSANAAGGQDLMDCSCTWLQWGAKKEKLCLQGDWTQSQRANMSLSFTSCIQWPRISKHLKWLLFLLS